MAGSYNNLIKAVIENSYSKTWSVAVLEWDIADVQEDEDKTFSCICGHPELRFLYTITNRKTGKSLFPIGSVCIHKFGREDLDEYTSITEKLFHLLHAVRKNEFIELTTEYFSKKLLAYLYDNDVFPDNEYNRYDGRVDYEFLLKMFLKRDKDSITSSQRKKIRGLIAYTIRPWLESQFGDKIKTKGQ